MIFFNKKSEELPWDIFIETLQKLRGEGSWRGNLIQLRKQGKLRLAIELRGKALHSDEIDILLDRDLEKIKAHSYKDGKEFLLKDHQLKIEDFLQTILKEVRQGTYIRTNKDKASYRN